MHDFKKCSGLIRSANKNKSAAIKIDGRGNLFLESNQGENETIELTNVLAAKDISNNLISLRRFADAGLAIYLVDEILRIFDKENGENYITDIYERPNCVISLSVRNAQNYENYFCMARLVPDDKFSQQT